MHIGQQHIVYLNIRSWPWLTFRALFSVQHGGLKRTFGLSGTLRFQTVYKSKNSVKRTTHTYIYMYNICNYV